MNLARLASTNLGYLTTQPEGRGQAPLATRPQCLPLQTLIPRDFERLCHRLTSLKAEVIQCRTYGVPGQRQAGIDLYAKKATGSYLVVQCKRSADGFTAREIVAAVDTFLKGKWAKDADEFVLAVSANLDETKLCDCIEAQRKRLDRHNITFVVWDETEISTVLKTQSKLVADFFGNEAASIYCGEGQGQQLAAGGVRHFRHRPKRWKVLLATGVAAASITALFAIGRDITALNCREAYRVDTRGSMDQYTNVIGENGKSLGRAFDGDRFARDLCADVPEHAGRFYGKVEDRNLTGYVLAEKLRREQG